MIATTVVAVVATIWIYRGVLARAAPELELWHVYEPVNEFHARDYPDGISFSEYVALEERLQQELDDEIYSEVEKTNRSRYNRFDRNSIVFAGGDSRRWNRSFELAAEDPAGGIVLLHGASDSPYSTRALAELFHDQGLYVLSARLPGHGTVPAGLKRVRLEDWRAITRMAVDHVREVIGPDASLYVAGYSVGAALAIDHTLQAATSTEPQLPDKLFLYSPAIGITPAARFTDWDLALSRVPWFEKFAWFEIEPEFDPWKYNSFAKNAGDLTWQLTRHIRERLDDPDMIARLPPIIAFQSLVDSTTRADLLVERLYLENSEDRNELVLFDVNRANDIEHFIDDVQEPLLERLNGDDALSFSFTLVGNESPDSLQVVARNRSAGQLDTSIVPLDAAWPAAVYSLSHVALPFRYDDPWYGGRTESGGAGSILGTLAPRGETAILTTPVSRFMRLRHNPFFDYLALRTVAFCDVCRTTVELETAPD